jgi:CHASE2 domain-containing sensor protein
MSLATTVIGIASVAVTGLLLGSRQLGWLQPLELMMFDRLMQINVQREPDPRLLVVGITEADIQAQQRFPLSDRTIAQGLKKLKSYQPRTIGLDLLRDIPQEPGRSELLAELNAPNVIAITNLGGDGQPVTPAPPQVPSDRVGFNDLVLDPDGVVRRNLLFADGEQTTVYSFSLRLAISYLKPQGMSLQTSYRDPDVFRLGQSTFQPLEPNSGGYGAIDARGYQVLLRYRSPTVARQVSLTEVLKNQVKPEWVRDKIVLIGTTAANQKDLFFTPYSAIEPETPRLAGVVVHAHAVSQLLDAALEGRSLFWFWSESQEMLWLVAWAIAGGTVAWFIRHPIVLGLSGAGLLLLLMATGMGAFRTQGWIPIVAPALAATMTGGVIVAYRAYWV